MTHRLQELRPRGRRLLGASPGDRGNGTSQWRATAPECRLESPGKECEAIVLKAVIPILLYYTIEELAHQHCTQYVQGRMVLLTRYMMCSSLSRTKLCRAFLSSANTTSASSGERAEATVADPSCVAWYSLTP